MAEERTETGDRVNGRGRGRRKEGMLKPGTIDRDNPGLLSGLSRL